MNSETRSFADASAADVSAADTSVPDTLVADMSAREDSTGVQVSPVAYTVLVD
jgi:hypothetical protein